MSMCRKFEYRGFVALTMWCLAAWVGWSQLVSSSIPAAAVFDFGSLARESSVQHTFVIANTAAVPLALAKVRPSCDCLQILCYPREIAPQSAGAIICRLIPDKVGVVDYKIYVESSDPADPIRSFSLRGTVVPGTNKTQQIGNYAGIDPQALGRVLIPRDASCYLSAAAVQAKLSAGEDLMLIDLRSARAFESIRIPGSLNLPLYALKTRSHLRSSNLALVDEAGGDPALEQECRQLRQNGFPAIWILRGGLNAWRQAGGKLQGDAFAAGKVDRLSPADFFRARNFADWLVVDAGGGKERSAYLFADRVSIPWTGNGAEFARQLETALQAQGLGKQAGAQAPSAGGSIGAVLILNERGEGYDHLAAALAGMSDVTVYYLDGGLAGYEQYLCRLSARPEVRTAGTTGARVSSRGTIVKKSCGGCPG